MRTILSKQIRTLLTLIVLQTVLYAQPSQSDYALGYGGLLLTGSSTFIVNKIYQPKEPRWIVPGAFDRRIRQAVVWPQDRFDTAARISDYLLFGVFAPSVFWSPLLGDENYGKHLLINVQVAAATGLATQLAKYMFLRQRPYSFFNTRNATGTEDFISFFSGHTSMAFATAVSSSWLLQKKYAQSSALLWTGSLSLAAYIGYLRIAADKHYMTDVLVGAVIGSFLGYTISKHQERRFFRKKDSKKDEEMRIVLSLPIYF